MSRQEMPNASPEGEHFVDVEPVNKKEKRSLYKKRVKIFPKRVAGPFRQLKWYIMIMSLGVYYLAPWLRWNRGPGAPDQAILIDFPGQRFYFFFIEIWPQELFYIAGLLIMAGIGLFLAASVIGRAWCGYFCPQTVWVDLFVLVERWIEGDRNARMRLDKAPLGFDKIRKRSIKFFTWLVIAMATGGAWVFYFADAPTLAKNLLLFEAPAIAYITIGVLTATTFTFGGFAREQVCTYMCPWPRIQAAMTDEDTYTVTYRGWRGEPRQNRKAKKEGEGSPRARGDCIDCNLCVAVCPMGIDIRDGLQLECISCGLCVDACNGVMEKTGRPANLIAYDTYRRMALKDRGEEVHHVPLIRPRTIVYVAIWCIVGLVMAWNLATRDTLELNVIRDRNPLFVTLSDGSIRNGYTLHIRNMLHRPREMMLSVEGLSDARILLGGEQLALPFLPVSVPKDKMQPLKVFVVSKDPKVQQESTEITFRLLDSGDGKIERRSIAFRGPGKKDG